MSQYLVDQIGATPNIQIWPRTLVKAARGNGRLESILLSRNDEETEVSAHALFVLIGAIPFTDWLGDNILRDDHGFIISGPEVVRHPSGARVWKLDRQPYLLETCVPGIFVAGDVRTGSLKRVASAVGEGAAAVMFIHQYLATV
jgi:thioredoxin reductase (NADPH)